MTEWFRFQSTIQSIDDSNEIKKIGADLNYISKYLDKEKFSS